MDRDTTEYMYTHTTWSHDPGYTLYTHNTITANHTYQHDLYTHTYTLVLAGGLSSSSEEPSCPCSASLVPSSHQIRIIVSTLVSPGVGSYYRY